MMGSVGELRALFEQARIPSNIVQKLCIHLDRRVDLGEFFFVAEASEQLLVRPRQCVQILPPPIVGR